MSSPNGFRYYVSVTDSTCQTRREYENRKDGILTAAPPLAEVAETRDDICLLIQALVDPAGDLYGTARMLAIMCGEVT